MPQKVLRISNFFYIFGLLKNIFSFNSREISSSQQSYCRVQPNYCMQVCSLCWHLISSTVLGISISILFLDLEKIAKICQTVNIKMVMFTKVIACFVFNFVYCFEKPLGT